MKKYKIAVTRTIIELWHVRAESEAEALEDWGSGELVEPEHYDCVDGVESKGEVK